GRSVMKWRPPAAIADTRVVTFVLLASFALTLRLTFMIGARLWGRGLAMILLTLDLLSFTYTQILFADTLFTAALITACYAAVEHLLTDRVRWAAGFATALAVATLVRPISYYLFWPIAAAMLIRHWAGCARPGRGHRASCSPALRPTSCSSPPARKRMPASACRSCHASRCSLAAVWLPSGRRTHRVEQRPGHRGRDDRHDDHHREQGRTDDADVHADVQDDQLHQAARVHQHAQPRREAPGQPDGACGDERSAELARRREQDDRQTDSPRRRRRHQADLGP